MQAWDFVQSYISYPDNLSNHIISGRRKMKKMLLFENAFKIVGLCDCKHNFFSKSVNSSRSLRVNEHTLLMHRIHCWSRPSILSSLIYLFIQFSGHERTDNHTPFYLYHKKLKSTWNIKLHLEYYEYRMSFIFIFRLLENVNIMFFIFF